MPEDLQIIAKEEGTNIAVKDYVAGMTDRFAVKMYSEIFVPQKF